MIDKQLKESLSDVFKKMKSKVVLTISIDSSESSLQLKDLVSDLAALSDLIEVQEATLERVPLLQVSSSIAESRVRFAGVPMGHEFTSLALAILQAGQGAEPKVSKQELDSIKSIDSKLDVEVYISLSCQNCPEVVQGFNQIALLNENVTSTMIDGKQFQSEVTERNVMAVPTVYVNGELFSQGKMSIAEILSKLDPKLSEKNKETINDKEPFDILVIGGGPSGASAAVYSARKGLRTGIVADRFGGQVADTVSIENFISLPNTTGQNLVASLENHVIEYDIDVMTGETAKELLPKEKTQDGYIHIVLQNGARLRTKSVIISTGARWKEMGVKGERIYKGKGVAYCPHCDGPLFKGRRTAVIGGGNSGIEAAIDLSGVVEHVTVLEFSDALRADKVLVDKAMATNNIQIVTSAQTTEVVGRGNKVSSLLYLDRISGEELELDVAGVFVQIGLSPNSEWLLSSGLDINSRGEIITDSVGSTNLNGVFAAGDVTDVVYKQIIIAMGEGAKASLACFDYLIRNS